MMSEMHSFGNWIQERRRAMNLTREELAGKVGCATVTIKKIERDERHPSRQMAEILADILAIPRLDRDVFMQMARGNYTENPGVAAGSLRIPPFLHPDGSFPLPAQVPFVERRRELSRLQVHLDQAVGRHAAPVFLLGDAGSGKTTLMREFVRIAQSANPGLLVAGGQCNAQTGPGDPFRPFRDILGILTGEFEVDWTVGMINREQALRIWAAIPGILQAITANGPHLLDSLLPVDPLVHRLAPHLGADSGWFDRFQAAIPIQPPRHSDLEQVQLVEELTRVFRVVSDQNPLLLILDDLQWADEASLNFLFHLGRRLAGSRIMLIGAYRTGEVLNSAEETGQDSSAALAPEKLVLELTRQYGDIQVRLDHSNPENGRAFINAFLDLEPNRLGEVFREDLYLHTRGHPLFTVEMLHSMRQNQNIVLDPEGYWVENQASLPAPRPARVEAVIGQRLAALNSLQREALNIASVEGEWFTNEIVANVLGLDAAQALKLFIHDLGQQHHLVQEQGQHHAPSIGLNRFQFHHAVIQEYLYSQLQAGEKRRLHARIAEELEKILLGTDRERISSSLITAVSGAFVPPEYLDTFGPALLNHFRLGEAWDKAAVYACQLGKRAVQRYAMREAMAYFEQAMRSVENVGGDQAQLLFDILLGWEEAAFKFKPYQDQLTNLARAEAIARDLRDKPRLIQALHWTANVLLAQGRWTQAGPSLAECLALAQELGDEELSVRPTYFKALMTTFADPSQAVGLIDLAADLSRKYNDLQIEALSLATEAQVLAQIGEFERSKMAIEQARRLSVRLASPLTESDVDLFAAWANISMGNPEQALELGRRSVDKAIATDNMDCICNGMTCIGYANLEMGRIPDATAAFETGIERSEMTGAMIPLLNGQAGLAMTRFLGGSLEAVEELEKVATHMREAAFFVGAANTSYLLGLCFIQLGDLERARRYLNQAIDFYRQSQMYPSLGKALRSLSGLMERPAQS